MSNLIMYADEAWTQQDPLYRYHCFFGGFLGSETDFSYLEERIKELKKRHKYTKEIKWTNVSLKNHNFYIDIIDLFKDIMLDPNLTIKYRQLFLDRVLSYKDEPTTTVDAQFKVYYQFIKHSFGLGYLTNKSTITINLDTHSSHSNKNKLRDFVTDLPIILDNPNLLNCKIQFIVSRSSLSLQLCDLLMGAAGYYGNNLFNTKNSGQKRISKTQSMKKKLGKKIYDSLREIDNSLRNRKAFNWFETTGIDGDKTNHYHHKLRIWKFEPKNVSYRKEWENDNFPNDAPRIISV